MICIIFALLFRINPLKVQNIQKKELNQFYDCLDEENEEYIFQDGDYYSQYFIKCDSSKGTLLRFKSVQFQGVKIQTSSNDILINTENVDCYLEKCDFIDCSFSKSLIYFNSPQNTFTLYKNFMNLCSGNDILIESNAFRSDFQDNTILFDIDNGCTAFKIQQSKNTVFKNNFINNAKASSGTGSGLLFSGSGTGDPLEMSGCIFTNCRAKDDSIFSISAHDYELVISNTTFEKTSSIITGSSYSKTGSLLGFTNSRGSLPKITFSKCTFSFLESKSVGMGTIGLYLKGPMTGFTYDLLFEDTVFEHMFYPDSSIQGGVFLFNSKLPATMIKGASLTLKNCSFVNVSTTKGGAAITYDPNIQLTLSIEGTHFTDVFATEQGSSGGALYINYQANSLPVTISDCSFDNVRVTEGNGNAIYLSSSVSQKCTIEGCSFNDCGSQGFVVYCEIPELLFDSSEISFTDKANMQGICISKKGQFTITNSNFTRMSQSPIQFVTETNPSVEYSIDVSYCTFNSCTLSTNNYIVFPTDYAQSSYNLLTFIDCYTTKNYVFYEDPGSLSFSNCIFEFTGTNKKYGGIKMANSKTEITIDSCLFKNCYSSGTAGGAALYLEKIDQLLVQNCTFLNNQGGTSVGGAIRLKGFDATDQGTHYNTIKDCYFSGNKATNGHAIHSSLSSTFCDISNCIFEDNSNSKYVVDIEKSKELKFDSNIVNFTSTDNACAAIQIEARGVNYITNCIFYQTSSDGSIYYVMTSTGSPSFILTIENCIFDKVSGSNNPAFNIQFNHPVTFFNNTIQNVKSNFIASIKPASSYTNKKVVLSSFKFINLTNTMPDGTTETKCGGCGIIVYINQNTQCSVTFENCLFENNKAPNGNGGAVDYGSNNEDSKNVQMNFDCCQFNNNVATVNGGAISVCTMIQATIQNCTFNGNTAEKGGSIYINPKKYAMTGQCSILNCSFDSNSAQGSGHAIFLDENSENADCFIGDGSTFKNNHGQNSAETEGVILLANSKVTVKDTSFIFEESSKKLLPFAFVTTSIILSDSTFENVNSDGDQLFSFPSSCKALSITNCDFTNCNTANYIINNACGKLSLGSSTVKYTDDVSDDKSCHLNKKIKAAIKLS